MGGRVGRVEDGLGEGGGECGLGGLWGVDWGRERRLLVEGLGDLARSGCQTRLMLGATLAGRAGRRPQSMYARCSGDLAAASVAAALPVGPRSAAETAVGRVGAGRAAGAGAWAGTSRGEEGCRSRQTAWVGRGVRP